MKKSTRILSGLTGTAALLGGGMNYAAAAPQDVAAVADESGVTVEARAQEQYDKIANVEGTFSFTQNKLTPPDEVFNLFGTAATYACAKPGFAFSPETSEVYYINVGGRVKKAYTISLSELKSRRTWTLNMLCSCATGNAIVNARVTGVPLKDILDMSQVEEDANTIVMRDSEGYGLPLPLSYVMEKEAMLVYKVGDQDLPESMGSLQVWIPDTVAKYFTRNVTEIELLAQDEVPEVEGAEEAQRAKVNIVNRMTSALHVGDSICFEGYADDCGTPIAAVEFSMDNGETWTSCATKGASTTEWVYWYFDHVAMQPGTFKLDVRARTADGTVSPLASSIVFTVEDGQGA